MTRAQTQMKEDFRTMYRIARLAKYDNDIMRKRFSRMYHFMDYDKNIFYVGLKARITNFFVSYDFTNNVTYFHYYGKTIILSEPNHIPLNRLKAYLYFGVK